MAKTTTAKKPAPAEKPHKLTLKERLRRIFRYKIRLNPIEHKEGEEGAEQPPEPEDKKARKQRLKEEKKARKAEKKKNKGGKKGKDDKGGSQAEGPEKSEASQKSEKSEKSDGADEKKSKKGYLLLAIVCGAVGMAGAAFGIVTLVQYNQVDNMLVRARNHYTEGAYESAVKTYEKVLGKDDRQVAAYLGIADSYLEEELREEAIEILELGAEITRDPRIAERLAALAAEDEEELEEEDGSKPIQWADSALESMVRTMLGIPSRDILPEDLESIRAIKILGGTHVAGGSKVSDATINALNGMEGYQYNGTLFTTRGAISTLDDLVHFTGLRKLTIGYNHIGDISGVSRLEHLDTLALYCNDIADLSPLEGMESLKYVYLYNNRIADLSPLSFLSGLRVLWLQHNQIADLSPLSGLSELEELFVSNNQVSSIIPLAGLPKLRILYADDNSVADLSPLSSLTALTDVSFVDNPVQDFSPVSHAGNVNRVYAGLSLDGEASTGGEQPQAVGAGSE